MSALVIAYVLSPGSFCLGSMAKWMMPLPINVQII